MYPSKSPGLKLCESSGAVVKYRSCFNTDGDSNKYYKISDLGCKALKDRFRDNHNPPYKPVVAAKFEGSSDTLPGTESTESLCKYYSSISPVSSEETVHAKKRDETEKQPKELDGYVGFANLPNQVYWRAVKKGFEFTLMIVGESGLGKSTLVNSMFLTDIYNSEYPGPTQRFKKTTTVEVTKVLLKESGVNLLLSVVDTPGFADGIDNTNCWNPIIQFIENKYEEYFQAETRINRKEVSDQRVHCCLFCIQPSGHGLKPLDIEFMRHLHDKVNIVPIIAKADTLTVEECATFKARILEEIKENNIRIYDFPDVPEEDEEYELNKSLKEKVPFAVVGSNTVVEVNGKKVRGRAYPWGLVNIESLDHCDFMALKKMLISTHLQDLKDVTHDVHYENYRSRKLSAVADENSVAANKIHERLSKLEVEMEEQLERKVRESLLGLKKREEELKKECDATKKSLLQQERELQVRRRQYELEQEIWEKAKMNMCKVRKGTLESSGESIEEKKDKKKKGLF